MLLFLVQKQEGRGTLRSLHPTHFKIQKQGSKISVTSLVTTSEITAYLILHGFCQSHHLSV